ncbi:MAG: hypothetical protein INR69_07610 [Mucilaginibacter polytrichastri]|nr:hypothetical protein [Mucilaginibacter polytrichastri]
MNQESIGTELWENMKTLMGITDSEDPEGLFSSEEIERLRGIYGGVYISSSPQEGRD